MLLLSLQCNSGCCPPCPLCVCTQRHAVLQNTVSINACASSCRKDFLFISHMSWICAVSSLAAQSWLRSSFCSFKFDSLSPQLAPCRAPAPCGAGSCWPTCPGPGSCSIIHLQEGSLQWKLLPCPSLGSVCSSGAQKTKKDLGGKNLWVVTAGY